MKDLLQNALAEGGCAHLNDAQQWQWNANCHRCEKGVKTCHLGDCETLALFCGSLYVLKNTLCALRRSSQIARGKVTEIDVEKISPVVMLSAVLSSAVFSLEMVEAEVAAACGVYIDGVLRERAGEQPEACLEDVAESVGREAAADAFLRDMGE